MRADMTAPPPETRTGLNALVHGTGVAIWAVMMAPMRFVRWLAEWLSWWTATPRRRIMAVSLGALLVSGALVTKTSRLELAYEQAPMERAQSAEASYMPAAPVLKALALDHRPFLADMLFTRANMYFISHLFTDRIYNWLDVYAEAILALDPDNPRVYEWASQSLKYGQMINKETLERSNDYARRGIEHFPDHWRFYFDIGFNYYIEWKHEDEAERLAMQEKALPYFSIAASLPGSQLDPNFVTELYLQRNDVSMALFHAYLRYWESSERERASLRGRITRYQSAAAATRLERIEDRWKSDYGYMPFGLFEALGPEREGLPPSTWTEMPLDGARGG